MIIGGPVVEMGQTVVLTARDRIRFQQGVQEFFRRRPDIASQIQHATNPIAEIKSLIESGTIPIFSIISKQRGENLSGRLGQWEALITAIAPTLIKTVASAAGVKTPEVQAAEAAAAAQQAAAQRAAAEAAAAEAKARAAAAQQALLVAQEGGGIPTAVYIVGGVVVLGIVGYLALK